MDFKEWKSFYFVDRNDAEIYAWALYAAGVLFGMGALMLFLGG